MAYQLKAVDETTGGEVNLLDITSDGDSLALASGNISCLDIILSDYGLVPPAGTDNQIIFDGVSGQKVMRFFDQSLGGGLGAWVAVVDDNYPFGAGDLGGSPSGPSVTGFNGVALAGNPVADQYAYIYDVLSNTWQEVQVVGAGDHIMVGLWSYSTAAGTWVITTDSNAFQGGYLENTTGPGNNGDQVDFSVFLGRGTYSFYLLTLNDSSCGIADVLVNGVSTGTTIDTYASPKAYNQIGTIPGYAVTPEGWYTVSVQVNGQNPSSSGFDMYLQGLLIVRTGP